MNWKMIRTMLEGAALVAGAALLLGLGYLLLHINGVL